DFSEGSTPELHDLSDLIVMIPFQEAESLLTVHWDDLRFSPQMIQAALRVGTPICVALARDALAACPATVDVFRYAFSSIWERPHVTNPLTVTHLENLLPYLEQIGEEELLFLAWLTERTPDPDRSIACWIRKHLVPRLSEQE